MVSGHMIGERTAEEAAEELEAYSHTNGTGLLASADVDLTLNVLKFKTIQLVCSRKHLQSCEIKFLKNNVYQKFIMSCWCTVVK